MFLDVYRDRHGRRVGCCGRGIVDLRAIPVVVLAKARTHTAESIHSEKCKAACFVKPNPVAMGPGFRQDDGWANFFPYPLLRFAVQSKRESPSHRRDLSVTRATKIPVAKSKAPVSN